MGASRSASRAKSSSSCVYRRVPAQSNIDPAAKQKTNWESPVTDLTLYTAEVCPYAQRTRIVLGEKAIAHESVEVDLGDKPDWLQELTPTGRVPVIRHGDFVLWESAIINWSNRHRPTVDPERCSGCGGIIEQSLTGWRPLADGAIVHYGGMWGLKCWRRHNEARRIEAAIALECLGLQRPLEWIA